MKLTTKARGLAALAVLLGLAVALFAAHDEPWPSRANASAAIPGPVFDEPAGNPGTSETAVLAGGCFWGVQGVYQHVKGVSSAVSGYAGGDASTAHYETVGTGSTGHAESVRITYDPTQVTFGQLLHIFFAVATDPTELNRQGPDVGSQYRSAIFPQNDIQKKVADAYIAQLNQAKVFDAPVVTRTERDSGFFPAEDYHQDYLNSNPTAPYIAINDMPKLDNLRQVFPQLYRDQPVLVHASNGG
ncbi:peptide-methionine (S)-S-oxide reductase MsrA [Mycolicibacterium moriokaense]|uniref:Peptide methionine sulfoxide reductase MsrA n=1 Tax=Mycolicibacterium moriokaense TaxID=39691 RepID=A0A318HV08_9MYCO|nr:peptide-methionine (S)-S-oxide reductase MsrA [Mycolicibacterium moriokaense]PXX12139.1 peptide-methionine (S)-S-oxide reductase [Mycolicibacterium moriokaense]